MKKSVTAEETSDLSSSNDIQRKRKINAKYLQSSSSRSSNSESEIESDLDSTRMPTFPESLSKKIKTVPQGKKSSCLTAKRVSAQTCAIQSQSTESQHTSRMTPYDTPSQVLTRPSTSQSSKNGGTGIYDTPRQDKVRAYLNAIEGIGTPETAIQDAEFKRKVLTKLNIICAKLSQHEDNFEDLRMLIQQSRGIDVESNNDIYDGLNLLPLEEHSLADFELFLGDKEKSKSLAKELSRIGGSSVAEITKKIMYRTITNEFGQLYSWEGGKGKRKFIDLSISKVIIDAVRKNSRTKEACDDEIITEIKKWLVKAKERIANRNKSRDRKNGTAPEGNQ